MSLSRRRLLTGAASLAAASRALDAAVLPATSSVISQGRVRTLNGSSLPWRMVNGVKEFQLVAGEFEHEFAPGCKARCWGYNGSTPGPTIEAVEGDRVRILITNTLPEGTSIHWHGILLPNGMDGISGLNQEPIAPGETWAYEFTLRQEGTYLYHPHVDEMTQLAFGMMGFFIVHPRVPHDPPVQRDYAMLLHNWALHPGTYRPDPSVMTEFDLWTFNSKVFPATEPLLAAQGERVRLRVANLSMHHHPIHLHGHRFAVTGGDGGRWPRQAWLPEVTTIVGVGQTRDIEFVADNPGDWALHCHLSHHTMNAMGHGIANSVGVKMEGLETRIRKQLPGFMAMGEDGMQQHLEHAQHMRGPENTLPMAQGEGPFGAIGMGGMMTMLKVRRGLQGNVDPGWYEVKDVPRARRVDTASPAAPKDQDAPEHHQHAE